MSKWTFKNFSEETARKILNTTLPKSYKEYEEFLTNKPPKNLTDNKSHSEILEETNKQAICILIAAVPKSPPRIFNLEIRSLKKEEETLPSFHHSSLKMDDTSMDEYEKGMDLQTALSKMAEEISPGN